MGARPFAFRRAAGVLAFALAAGAGINAAQAVPSYTVGEYALQASDVSSTPGLTVFPVPAAAPMSSDLGSTLIYNNSTVGLAFSSSYYQGGNFDASNPNLQWYNGGSSPASNSNVTINFIGNFTQTGGGPVDPSTITIDNTGASGEFLVNDQGTTSTGNSYLYPYNIPRLGGTGASIYTANAGNGNAFLAAQFVLAQPAHSFGVYLAANTNAIYNENTDDNNYNNSSVSGLDIVVQGVGQTMAQAEVYQVKWTNQASTFVEVDWDGTTAIQSVSIIQDSNFESGPPLSFFDVYTSVPEPASLSLLGFAGLLEPGPKARPPLMCRE